MAPFFRLHCHVVTAQPPCTHSRHSGGSQWGTVDEISGVLLPGSNWPIKTIFPFSPDRHHNAHSPDASCVSQVSQILRLCCAFDLFFLECGLPRDLLNSLLLGGELRGGVRCYGDLLPIRRSHKTSM